MQVNIGSQLSFVRKVFRDGFIILTTVNMLLLSSCKSDLPMSKAKSEYNIEESENRSAISLRPDTAKSMQTTADTAAEGGCLKKVCMLIGGLAFASSIGFNIYQALKIEDLSNNYEILNANFKDLNSTFVNLNDSSANLNTNFFDLNSSLVDLSNDVNSLTNTTNYANNNLNTLVSDFTTLNEVVCRFMVNGCIACSTFVLSNTTKYFIITCEKCISGTWPTISTDSDPDTWSGVTNSCLVEPNTIENCVNMQDNPSGNSLTNPQCKNCADNTYLSNDASQCVTCQALIPNCQAGRCVKNIDSDGKEYTTCTS